MAGQQPTTQAQTQDRSTGPGRQAFDKSQSAPRSGSVGLVLLIALALIAAAAGLIYIDRPYAGTYILALLALLGTIGVFALFAIASGIMQLASRSERNPLLKAVVDSAFDGIVVTDQSGRVFYANATYLDLIGPPGGHSDRDRAAHRVADQMDRPLALPFEQVGDRGRVRADRVVAIGGGAGRERRA